LYAYKYFNKQRNVNILHAMLIKMNYNQSRLLIMIKLSIEVPDVPPMKIAFSMHLGRGQLTANVSSTVLQVAVWPSFEGYST